MLSAWTALEVLSPQAFQRPADLVPGHPNWVHSLEQHRLPWDGDHVPGLHHNRLFFQVSLGELKLEPAFEELQRVFGETAPDRFRPKARALLGVVVCDREGVPQENRVAISSFGWALPQALERDLRNIGGWRAEEDEIRRELGEHLCRRGRNGEPAALNWDTLVRAHKWLVGRLGLDGRFVTPPTFALRSFVPLFVHEPAEPLILNSFFLADLARAQALASAGRLPPALARYVGFLRPEARRDVLTEPGVLQGLLAPERTPTARWPAPGRPRLVTLQQAAVNAAASSRPGEVTAVNGPPGTGKTTLLRDLVASVVTARAEVLANFEDPRQAFKSTGVTFTQRGATFAVHSIDAKLHGFEMVVASSNNAAVENVSAELPLVDNVASDHPSPRYFPSVASSLAGRECWGLIAAVLGNSSNQYRFREALWGDEDHGLESYLATAAGTPRQFTPDGESQPRTPRVVIEERPPPGPGAALQRWQVARQAFLDALDRCRRAGAELQRIHALEASAAARRAQRAQLQEGLSGVDSRELGVRRTLEAAQANVAQSRAPVEAALRTRELVQGKAPGVFARLFRTQAARAWSDEARAAQLAVESAEAAHAEHVASVRQQEQQLKELEDQRIALRSQLHALEAADAELLRVPEAIRARSAWRLADLEHADQQRATPWFTESEQRLRDEVFIAALNLQRAFIDVAAQPVRHNLAAYFRQQWTGVPGASAAHIRDLWSTLCLVVPLVSTTFASVERMLGELEPGALGWVLIDEGGQATPQSAVGIIMRAQRAVVVGDPLQIEPVVSLPSSLVEGVCRAFEVNAQLSAAPFVSAQVFADRASAFCATYEMRHGSRTVGLPLLVHRRCEEPMFSISNSVAYGNLMVNATPARQSAVGQVLGPSRWIDVCGSASDRHWCPEEGATLLRMLRLLVERQIEADLYVVSPFRAVVAGLRQVVQADARVARLVGAVDERIGTIHTVQGREADAVFFVLGSPEPDQNGARQWAGSTPNLLNVAVTRARQRLYVIGNRSLWEGAGHFSALARLPG